MIGGGVLGTATARALALRGAAVTVFERTGFAAGTTGTTFAWINSHAKNPISYHELNVAGVDEHHALREAGGPAPDWFFPAGNLEWAADDVGDGRLADALELLEGRNYPWRWLKPDRARELVPDLRIPEEVRRIAYFPEEGYVLPHPLVARLWGEARDHGAELRCPADVTGIDERASDVRIELADGTSEAFDFAVSATGRWSERTAALTGVSLPMADTTEPGSATVGLLGYTSPTAARLDAVLTTPRLNVRPDGAAGSSSRASTWTRTPTRPRRRRWTARTPPNSWTGWRTCCTERAARASNRSASANAPSPRTASRWRAGCARTAGSTRWLRTAGSRWGRCSDASRRTSC